MSKRKPKPVTAAEQPATAETDSISWANDAASEAAAAKFAEPQQPQPPPPLRLEWRSPAELAENPSNWRTHPAEQLAALSDVVSEVGWAGACLYNERTGRLIDGHARRKVALDQGCERIPVLVGNWDEATEKKILATLDPLAGMAVADAAALDALLHDVETGSPALQQMLTDLAESAGVIPGMGGEEAGDGSPDFQPVSIDEQGKLDEKAKTKCPECGHEF